MLLALNNLTNIADERFFAFHVPGTERFSLRLARARVADSGFYECQVATREGEAPLFRLIYLDVVREFTLLPGRPGPRPVMFCRQRMLRPAKLAQFPLQYPLSVCCARARLPASVPPVSKIGQSFDVSFDMTGCRQGHFLIATQQTKF